MEFRELVKETINKIEYVKGDNGWRYCPYCSGIDPSDEKTLNGWPKHSAHNFREHNKFGHHDNCNILKIKQKLEEPK